ncbi:NADPH-dependent 2,4-dienoyl-CoA reductase, sulfur reductase [Variovorax sp. CF079]|uniref:FAD/NAD(P)-dependent oxidoreductase n=1 Tax=Variovorax sp. CF079 TaxID=1882774 RepID=UPI00087F2F35|nr:FAD/NAD(P)-binding oxidoreductase [Variovorax sp. CF079]SDE49277.1 NADPH-dependent 2,4-dienoyl-CoA reductase, sulfur reductase [Variovorax sp. CF079]
MAQPRVIVVGTGPAGVRCAQTLVAAGLSPTVVDEGRRDGGQIYRRQPEGFTRPYAKLYGSEATKARDLHHSFEAIRSKVDYRPETLAWHVTANTLHVVHDGTRTAALPFDALVVCSGATDRLMPVEGWNLAGCYSLGASQIALKSQACAIGRQIVFMGTGPLLYLVASQYVQAGAAVLAVLDTSRFSQRVRALPALAARPGLLLRGVALERVLRKAGVAVHSGITPLCITGAAAAGVQGVTVLDANGSERHFDCDAVALGYHLRAESQLADLARCEFRFDTESRQWLPKIDRDGRSTTFGVYLAGDGARILGADGAEASGRLAALAVLSDLGQHVSPDPMPALRRTLVKMDRFRRGLVKAFPWPHAHAAALPDSAVVCRCETITAGELRRVVNEMGGSEMNRAKAFSRVGMGRCQGRFCGHAAAEVVAHAAGVPIEMVGRLRGQGPVKPLPMAALENRGAVNV